MLVFTVQNNDNSARVLTVGVDQLPRYGSAPVKGYCL